MDREARACDVKQGAAGDRVWVVRCPELCGYAGDGLGFGAAEEGGPDFDEAGKVGDELDGDEFEEGDEEACVGC